jgi:hypothetical protein
MPKKFRTVIDPTKVIVDNETGEVISAVAKRVCDTQEEFIKIYLNSIDDLISLDNRMFQVLMVCLREAKFCDEKNQDGNTLYNFKDFKDKCRNLIDPELSDKAINMYVSRLASMQILIRKSRGMFVLNPRYFVKGQMTPKTRLQLVVEYEGK